MGYLSGQFDSKIRLHILHSLILNCNGGQKSHKAVSDTCCDVLFRISQGFPLILSVMMTSVDGSLNPFPNKPWFLRVCSTSFLETLWEKEKLLVTSNFSFSRSVFYLFGELAAIFIKSKIVPCQSFEYGRVKYLSFGKGLMKQKVAVGAEN